MGEPRNYTQKEAKMTENSPNNPNSAELIIAAFERLSTQEKLTVFEDVMCGLSDDLIKLKDPVLDRELDILNAIHTNIVGRIEEIAAIYGGIE